MCLGVNLPSKLCHILLKFWPQFMMLLLLITVAINANLEHRFSALWFVLDCQLPADVLKVKEHCAVTRRELAEHFCSPHVAHIRQSCDTKVGP